MMGSGLGSDELEFELLQPPTARAQASAGASIDKRFSLIVIFINVTNQ
jgi:hypothetical protein